MFEFCVVQNAGGRAGQMRAKNVVLMEEFDDTTASRINCSAPYGASKVSTQNYWDTLASTCSVFANREYGAGGGKSGGKRGGKNIKKTYRGRPPAPNWAGGASTGNYDSGFFPQYEQYPVYGWDGTSSTTHYYGAGGVAAANGAYAAEYHHYGMNDPYHGGVGPHYGGGVAGSYGAGETVGCWGNNSYQNAYTPQYVGRGEHADFLPPQPQGEHSQTSELFAAGGAGGYGGAEPSLSMERERYDDLSHHVPCGLGGSPRTQGRGESLDQVSRGGEATQSLAELGDATDLVSV